MRLRMTRRMKSFENMSDADIVQTIATEHGMQAETDADGPRRLRSCSNGIWAILPYCENVPG